MKMQDKELGAEVRRRIIGRGFLLFLLFSSVKLAPILISQSVLFQLAHQCLGLMRHCLDSEQKVNFKGRWVCVGLEVISGSQLTCVSWKERTSSCRRVPCRGMKVFLLLLSRAFHLRLVSPKFMELVQNNWVSWHTAARDMGLNLSVTGQVIGGFAAMLDKDPGVQLPVLPHPHLILQENNHHKKSTSETLPVILTCCHAGREMSQYIYIIIRKFQ